MEDISLNVNNDIIWIKVNHIISLNELLVFVHKNGFDEDIILRNNLFYCKDIIGTYLYPQKIYAYKKDNNIFNISYLNDDKLVITHKIINNSVSTESKILFDLNNPINYNKEQLNNARKLLENIEKYGLNRYVDLDVLYRNLRIRPNYDYNYVIENDSIALSVRKKYEKCMKDLKTGDFDIILKNTKEHIGNIEFDSHYEVSYFIDDKFRGKHYATSALNLLIKLLKTRRINVDISLVALNEMSKKIILNNGGKFEEIIPYMDGNYPMYSIKI